MQYNKKAKLRRQQSDRLQERAYKVAQIKQQRLDDMAQFGLGSGSAASAFGGGGARTGKNGFGQVEVQWGKEK